MKIDKAFQLAYKYYQAGALHEAGNIYKKILRDQPKNIDTLHSLVMICCQLGDYDDAIRYIKKEIEITPSNADAYNNLGIVLQAKGLLSEAIDYFRKAITLEPHFPEAYYNLGFAFQNTGQPDGAILNYKKAIQIEPGLVEAYNNLGLLLRAEGHLEEAITYFQKAIRINPDYANIYNNLGLSLQDKGNIDEAIINYQKAINLNPDFADAYYNLGIALQGKKQLDEAINFYKKAIQLNPNYAAAYNNLGSIYHNKGQFDEAIDCYQKALKLKPDFTDAYNNLGVAFNDRGQIDEAINYYQKALQIDPTNAEAHFRMSSTLLLSGNFKEGWKEYEWRWKLKDFFTYTYTYKRNFDQPLWDGSSIKDKFILLFAEQGLGDIIQFIRYAKLLAQRGARVLFECPRELSALLKSIEGIHQIINWGDTLPAFDVYCPLMSLPFKFNTTIDTIPVEIPYISADPLLIQSWEEKMKIRESAGRINIGIVWAGNPKFKKARIKACSLETFSPLSQFKDITFYSLQKGQTAEQAKSPPDGMKFIDYTDEIKDFSDTAAFIMNLDLVISVDTAVAHLAGALGKPVWTLIPFDPDWRWMLNREDSPWYPTMRLFRQPSWGDWESVINNVLRNLELFIRDENR